MSAETRAAVSAYILDVDTQLIKHSILLEQVFLTQSILMYIINATSLLSFMKLELKKIGLSRRTGPKKCENLLD